MLRRFQPSLRAQTLVMVGRSFPTGQEGGANAANGAQHPAFRVQNGTTVWSITTYGQCFRTRCLNVSFSRCGF